MNQLICSGIIGELNLKNEKITRNFEFINIQENDVNDFITFLKEVRPDYPYRWYFDSNWIKERVFDENYIWGVVKENGKNKIIGTVICYHDQEKKIAVLKLLLVHPKYRKMGILNSLFFKRINEQRVIDKIISFKPHILFAEILNGHLTSQKMIIRMKMSFLGYYPHKTRIGEVNADLIPCALLFDRKHETILIDKRIEEKIAVILNTNQLSKLRTLKTDIQHQDVKKIVFNLKIEKKIDRPGLQIYHVEIDKDNFMEFRFNSYLNNILETRILSEDPTKVAFLIKYLKNFRANYTEVMISPDLKKQDMLIENEFIFTGFLPKFWQGKDQLVFSTWKNRPVLVKRVQKIFDNIIGGIHYVKN
ncbi:MAG: GNAT family N-acetyltransferase [Candidatus Helarchaeota archaeon]